jgi:hypothetical protein
MSATIRISSERTVSVTAHEQACALAISGPLFVMSVAINADQALELIAALAEFVRESRKHDRQRLADRLENGDVLAQNAALRALESKGKAALAAGKSR